MTTALFALARTLHVGSAMLLFAVPYFVLLILRPAPAADKAENYVSFCRNLIDWFRFALVLEVISGAVWFWLVAAQVDHQSPWSILTPAALGTALWQTPFGWLWQLRLGLGVALVVVFHLATRRETFVSSRPSFLTWLVVALSGGLLVSLAWAGHIAAGFHHQILHLLADTPHLLIGAIWPVGLIPMGYFLWHLRHRDRLLPTEREVEILQRFSQASLIAVALLLATGTINGWLMVGTWHNLIATWNGRLLLGKLLVVAVMIAVGAFNRFLVMPRIHDLPIMFRTLRRTVVAESCLGLLVLCIVGLHR